MTEHKKNNNPFVTLANKNKSKVPTTHGKNVNAPKPNKGFGGPNVVRRTGRGG